MKKIIIIFGLVSLIFLILPVSSVKYNIVPCSWSEIQQRATNDFVCVQRGDTLWEIYENFNVEAKTGWSKQQFAQNNNVPYVNYIYVGQKIAISEKGLEYLGGATKVPVEYEEYIVKEGESLWYIWLKENVWERYKVPFSEFFQKNREEGKLLKPEDPNYLETGQTILIPKQSQAPPPEDVTEKYVFDNANVIDQTTETLIETELKDFYDENRIILILETFNYFESEEKAKEYMERRFTDQTEIKSGLDRANNLDTLIVFVKQAPSEFKDVYFYGYYESQGGLSDNVEAEIGRDKIEEYSKKSDSEYLKFIVTEVSRLTEEGKPEEDEAKKLFEEAYKIYLKGPSFYYEADYKFEQLTLKYPKSEHSARAMLLRGHIASVWSSQNKAYKLYYQVYTDYKNLYPEHAEGGLYKAIKLRYEERKCRDVLSGWEEYQKAGYTKHKKEIQDFVDDCNYKNKILLENCKLIGEFKDGKKIDIVFVGDNYKNIDKFREHAEKIVKNGLLDADIIKRNEDKFNFYWVNVMGDDICKVESYEERKCDNNKIFQLARNCPRDKIILLSERDFRSYTYRGGKIIYLATRSTFIERIFGFDLEANAIHEFGHCLFNLLDEYVEEDRGKHPGFPNCAKDEEQAKYWWGDLAQQYPDVGYFEGCSYVKSNIKPTKKSVMSCHYSRPFYFGPVNEREIQRVIDFYTGRG